MKTLILTLLATAFIFNAQPAKADPTGLAVLSFGAMGIGFLAKGETEGTIKIDQRPYDYEILCEMNPRNETIPQCVADKAFVSAEEIKAFYEKQKAKLVKLYGDVKNELGQDN